MWQMAMLADESIAVTGSKSGVELYLAPVPAACAAQAEVQALGEYIASGDGTERSWRWVQTDCRPRGRRDRRFSPRESRALTTGRRRANKQARQHQPAPRLVTLSRYSNLESSELASPVARVPEPSDGDARFDGH